MSLLLFPVRNVLMDIKYFLKVYILILLYYIILFYYIILYIFLVDRRIVNNI